MSIHEFVMYRHLLN